MMKRVTFIIFAILCISIGLYPLMYFIMERTFGLLSSKLPELLQNTIWNIAFYTHILLGGLALLVGWIQFSKKYRTRQLKRHRQIGYVYMIAVLFSGLASLYIGYHATGGLVTATGFISLGLVWLFTTYKAFDAIKNKNITSHQKWMIYSYAACFAAVTLRIWLPLLTIAFDGFLPAYKIVAWLCWVPNIIVAYFIVSKLKVN